MQLGLLGVFVGLGFGLYSVVMFTPKSSRLHKNNIRKAQRLLNRIQNKKHSPGMLFDMLRHEDHFVFEEIILCCFKACGFRIKRNHAYTGDGCIDGTVFDEVGNKFLIQAKRYKSTINPQHVREFARVVDREVVTDGLFIHTGRTGPKSYRALLPVVRIISGDTLLELLGAKLPNSDKL